MKITTVIFLAVLVVSCGAKGTGGCDHYAQVSGPSPAGTVMLVINSECDYVVKLMNTASGDAKELAFGASDVGFRIKVLDDRVMLMNAFTKEVALVLDSGGSSFRKMQPNQKITLKTLRGSTFTWEIASAESHGSSATVELSVDFLMGASHRCHRCRALEP